MYKVYWKLAMAAWFLVSTIAIPDRSAPPADPSAPPADSSETSAGLSEARADPSALPADPSATHTDPDQQIAAILRSMQYLLGEVIGHQQNAETLGKGIYARLEDIASRQQGMASQQEDIASRQQSVESQLEHITSRQQGMERQQEDIASRQQGMESQQEDIASRQQGMESQQEDIASRQQGVESQLEHIASRQQTMESQLEDIASRQQDMESQQGSIASRQQGMESQQEDIISRLEGMETWQNYSTEAVASVAAETRILVAPRDCSDLPPGSPSGVYQVRLTSGVGSTVDAFCNQTIADGGWTVLQRRANIQPRQNFYLTWEDYKFGFGNMDGGEFWWGLEKLRRVTLSLGRKFQLRIDLEDKDGNWGYAIYENFSISSETDGYRLHASNYTGDVGDSLTYHVGQKFTTKDRDQDGRSSGNCAQMYEGAWWYASGCGYSTLNGRYEPGTSGDTVVWWYHWRNTKCLKTVEMKLRPV